MWRHRTRSDGRDRSRSRWCEPSHTCRRPWILEPSRCALPPSWGARGPRGPPDASGSLWAAWNSGNKRAPWEGPAVGLDVGQQVPVAITSQRLELSLGRHSCHPAFWNSLLMKRTPRGQWQGLLSNSLPRSLAVLPRGSRI